MEKIEVEKVVEKLRARLDEILSEEKEIFLVDFIHKGNDRAAKLLILLDGDEGLTIDQCASVSRRLSHYMDEELELDAPLNLEVSSSGLDHPLTLLRQYHKNVGKNVKVKQKGDKETEGKLIVVTEEKITVEVIKDKKKKITAMEEINFSEIDKTIVLISFNK